MRAQAAGRTSRLTRARHAAGAKALAPPFPFTFAAAVIVDAFVDGFLIGISGATGPRVGIVMSAALSIEMAFLGLTFA